MVALPLDMIRSRNRSGERSDVDEQLKLNREKQESIRRKAEGKRNRSINAGDRRRLEKLEHEERVIGQATRRADKLDNGFCGVLGRLFRPFEFIFGIVFLVLSVFLVISLAMTSADTLLQITQQHMDWKTGRQQNGGG